jgi:hypothetical protein
VRSTYLRLALAALLLAAALAGAWLWRASDRGALPVEVENSLQLRGLEPNRWFKYHEAQPGWTRQGHAGMAYDRKRGTLLVFGSDTHGENWDNSVHEFDPRRRRWETHQPLAGPQTYRVDAGSAPVAGTKEPMPWAMHTYDAIEYHPGLDALVVMSTTEHNPAAGKAGTIGRQPTWIYDLTRRQWSQFANRGEESPTFFGGSSAFDERRNLLVAYRHGLWELDVAAGQWRKASPEAKHGMHHTMVYDRRRGELLVFGDYRATNQVWRYRPGELAGEQGQWSSNAAAADSCPRLSSVPAAYAATEDLVVVVADDAPSGKPAGAQPETASTYFYDPASGRCSKLPAGALPRVGMNFMMAWDDVHAVVFLVTGDWRGPVTVWAMKPQRTALDDRGQR